MGAASSGQSIGKLLDRVVAWAAARSDIRAVALVGSYATGGQGDDSDVDLVVLTTRPSNYTTDDAWGAELDAGELVRTRHWGSITERRLRGPNGLEVEIGIGKLTWATTNPLDAGTRRVVMDGMSILYDPDDLLRNLVAACS